jgi:hypothetical protein
MISLSFPVSGSRLPVPVTSYPVAHADAITSGHGISGDITIHHAIHHKYE